MNYMGLASVQATLYFFFGQQQCTTVVTRGFALGHLFGAHLIQLFSGAETRERMTQRYQLLGVRLINVTALALPIWAVWASNVRTFAPLNTQPAQRIENLLFRLTSRTQLIGVFDAQDELTAMLLGKAVVEQCDVGSANVRVAGRRWRDSGADGGH